MSIYLDIERESSSSTAKETMARANERCIIHAFKIIMLSVISKPAQISPINVHQQSNVYHYSSQQRSAVFFVVSSSLLNVMHFKFVIAFSSVPMLYEYLSILSYYSINMPLN